jgi:uroporphyrinogen decarboxylase
MRLKFLEACRGEKQTTPPIWLMRQAGRYLPEYKKIRQEMTMLQAISTPEVAAEITLQPIRRFDFDAAILFSDLTVLFNPMGAPFDIKEGVGPVLETPIRSEAQIKALKKTTAKEDLAFVAKTIQILKGELQIPLIGFTGAPFTLASYLIEGGPSKDHRLTRKLLYSEPDLWDRLMRVMVPNIVDFLTMQVEAGADALQLFDSWIGVLDEPTYRRSVIPHMKELFAQLPNVPVIHFGTGTSALLPAMQEAGGSVIGVDWRLPIPSAINSLKPTPLQGNLDPALLLAPKQTIQEHAKRIVEEGRQAPGHIFNLGHGIYPDTPIEAVEALVEAVRSA